MLSIFLLYVLKGEVCYVDTEFFCYQRDLSCLLKFCSLFFLCFSIVFIVSNSFSPSPCNQNYFSFFSSFQYIFFNGNLKLIFDKRNNSLCFIINLFSNHNFTSKHIFSSLNFFMIVILDMILNSSKKL